MISNASDSTNDIISEVRKIRVELENIKRRKSKLKLDLFYDAENKEILKELDQIRERQYSLNIKMRDLNGRLMSILEKGE